MRCVVVRVSILSRLHHLTRVGCVLSALALAPACSDPPPPKTPTKQESVAANSLDDKRLHGEDDPNRKTPSETKPDPTQPYTTKVGETPAADPSGPTGSGSGSGKSGTGGAGSGGSGSGSGAGTGAAGTGTAKGAVSKGECNRVMDRYIDLEIARNPDLKGVPPDVIEQAKQMAREKHGEAPCTATRAQYTCAMAASSTGAWQKCMK